MIFFLNTNVVPVTINRIIYPVGLQLVPGLLVPPIGFLDVVPPVRGVGRSLHALVQRVVIIEGLSVLPLLLIPLLTTNIQSVKF